MVSTLTLLMKLLYNPLQAMVEIRSRAPYVAAMLLAMISSFLYHGTVSGEIAAVLAAGSGNLLLFVVSRMLSALGPILFLSVVFVPACLLGARIVDSTLRFGVLMRQEYLTLLSCVLYARAAVHLLIIVPAAFLFRTPPVGPVELALRLVPLPYFIFLTGLALRVVFQFSVGKVIGVLAISAGSLIALPLIPRLLVFLSSPFLLIVLFFVLRAIFSDVISAQRSRESFRQNLEAATLNPADSSAHYNLGLIHQERGEIREAKERYKRAIEVDPEEIDAHYQLGRMARSEGSLGEAISHFENAVRLDPEHAQSDVWREIGRTYLQAGQLDDARTAFERFLERRPSDAEGRYHYGLTLFELGQREAASREMEAVIEAVRTSPAYKYRNEKRWMNEAEAFLRSQSPSRGAV